MEENVIWLFNHEHPLFLKENVWKDEKVDCYVCGNFIVDSEMAYVCMEHHPSSSDRFILHKKCGELREQIRIFPIKHHFHLFDFRLLRDHKCDVCRSYLGKVVGYQCCSCDFRFHTTCVDILLGERKELQHPSHPLTLMRKPAFPFQCDGCGAQDVDMTYICNTCEYMVHKSCASLPTILPTGDQYHHHHHPLSLAFSFPEEHIKYDYNCEVCDKGIFGMRWVYYCGDCRYFVHIKCVGSTIKPDSNSIEEDDDGSGVIEFPLYTNEISNKLITPFVMTQKGIDNIPIPILIPDTTTNSFLFKYHHHHPLSLVSEAATDDELKISDACVTPISAPPYYHCTASACTYLIHTNCYFLPTTLHSSSNTNSQLHGDCQKTPNKSHNFTLYAPSSNSKTRDAISYWKCELCCVFTNGMGYKCEECGMMIDVKCASLPTTITHVFHPHHKHLIITRKLPQQVGVGKNYCHVCYYPFNIGYCCSEDDCDFELDFQCALLPKSITEREWDKHPLPLTFNASLDHPSDFFCEFCEEEMHPKSWMYHCRQCDVSFDLHCLKNASGLYRNMKFGGRYKLDGMHPNHPLTFTYITLKRRCDICDDDELVYTYPGFECASRYFVVCRSCGCKELENNF